MRASEAYGDLVKMNRKVEKAIFDLVYIRAAAGSKAFFPELDLPSDLNRATLRHWTQRIESQRLRTLVSRHLRAALAG